MSALGHKQTFAPQKAMSALPPKADMCIATRHVRYGPIADIRMSLSGSGLMDSAKSTPVSLLCQNLMAAKAMAYIFAYTVVGQQREA
jgi:hypothetical protein